MIKIPYIKMNVDGYSSFSVVDKKTKIKYKVYDKFYLPIPIGFIRDNNGKLFSTYLTGEIVTEETINNTAILSAIIPDNKKPEVKQKETSEQEEDRKHKTYFWLGLCVLVFLYAGFTKW